MKIAILLSTFLSAGIISAYSVVMNQINAMEDFYGNMDKYVSESMSTSNSTENPYTPKPLVQMSQPLSQ